MNYCDNCRTVLDWPRGDVPPTSVNEQCQMCGNETRCHSYSEESTLAQTAASRAHRMVYRTSWDRLLGKGF